MADSPKTPKIDFKAPEDLDMEKVVEAIWDLSASPLDILGALSRDFHSRLLAFESSYDHKRGEPLRISELRKDLILIKQTARSIECRQLETEIANAEVRHIRRTEEHF